MAKSVIPKTSIEKSRSVDFSMQLFISWYLQDV
jgi:hypothetical protein